MSFCNNQGIVIILGDFQNHSSLIMLLRNHSESSRRSDSKMKYPEPNIDPQVPTRSHHNSRYEILLRVLRDVLKANGVLIQRRHVLGRRVACCCCRGSNPQPFAKGGGGANQHVTMKLQKKITFSPTQARRDETGLTGTWR